MTKTQIINSVAFASCSLGDTLVEHEIPGSNLVVAHITAGDVGGLQIAAARIFEDQLVAEMEDVSEAPSPELFERLHKTCLEFNEELLEGAFFVAMEEDTKETHKKMIARLREIALKLGIQYEEPEDSLLGE